MQNQVDITSCPFCKGVNSCMVKSKNTCWCYTTNIPDELTAMVPKSLTNKSCICVNCIDAFNQNPANFKRQYTQTNS